MGSHLVQESAPQWNDYYLVFYFALAFPIIRLLLDVHIYQRLARWLIYPTDEKQLRVFLKNGPNKKMFKTTESMWKLSYYAVSEAFALFVIYKEPWFTSTKAFWESWQVQTLKFQLKLFYMYQCGFYVYSVAALLVWETRRKDFVVMLSHHVVTIGLISTSYILGFFRVGSVILALHDASDVFLESAKLFKYAGNEVGASIVFGLFVLSWLLLRLIYFPFWIIRSTSYEAQAYMDLTRSDIRLIYYYFNTLLITLLIMHIYWWVLISRMVLRQLENKGKVGDDVRSDSEDD